MEYAVRGDTGCGVNIWRAPRTRLIAVGYQSIKYWVQSRLRMGRCRIRLPGNMSTRRINALSGIRSTTFGFLAVFLVACASSEPPSESSRRANDPVSTAKPKGAWSESASPLPPYPQAENLVEFQIVGGSSFKFFADLTSVRVDADGVVRYTVIARSASGIDNVSFEGIHCVSREYKVYAYGSRDGTWVPARNPKWQSIVSISQNDLRNSLHRYYLCIKGVPPNNTEIAVQAMKRGRPYFDDYRKF